MRSKAQLEKSATVTPDLQPKHQKSVRFDQALGDEPDIVSKRTDEPTLEEILKTQTQSV